LREAGPLEATPPKEAEQPPENGTIRERLETAGLSVEETRPFFETLQSSVAAGDRAKVCTMMNYPLRVATMSDKIANEASCLQKYDRIFTAPVRDAVHQQRFDDLFANWQGVMIGNGQIWFSGICHDKKCVHKTVKVISIAN
jgi:hypothetical protein